MRLPAAVVEMLGLKEGDDIEILVAGERSVEVRRSFGQRELLARLHKYRGRLPTGFKFDRLEANEGASEQVPSPPPRRGRGLG